MDTILIIESMVPLDWVLLNIGSRKKWISDLMNEINEQNEGKELTIRWMDKWINEWTNKWNNNE